MRSVSRDTFGLRIIGGAQANKPVPKDRIKAYYVFGPNTPPAVGIFETPAFGYHPECTTIKEEGRSMNELRVEAANTADGLTGGEVLDAFGNLNKRLQVGVKDSFILCLCESMFKQNTTIITNTTLIINTFNVKDAEIQIVKNVLLKI